jgi:hypothetical protein
MLDSVQEAVIPSKTKSLAKSFTRLGWAGFWLQVVFGSIPVIVMAYYFAFSRTPTGARDGFPFVEYLALINLLLLAVTTIWSYRYTRLGRRMMDPERRPTESRIRKFIWTGVVISTTGLFFSMIVILIEAANLLFYFLKAPQGGMPVIQTSGAEAIHWVSSVDMVSFDCLGLRALAALSNVVGFARVSACRRAGTGPGKTCYGLSPSSRREANRRRSVSVMFALWSRMRIARSGSSLIILSTPRSMSRIIWRSSPIAHT